MIFHIHIYLVGSVLYRPLRQHRAARGTTRSSRWSTVCLRQTIGALQSNTPTGRKRSAGISDGFPKENGGVSREVGIATCQRQVFAPSGWHRKRWRGLRPLHPCIVSTNIAFCFLCKLPYVCFWWYFVSRLNPSPVWLGFFRFIQITVSFLIDLFAL